MPKVLGIKDGSIDADYGLEKKKDFSVIRKTFKRTYYVLGDTLDDTEDDIVITSGIPPLFFPLNGCFCNSLKPKETNRVRHPTTGTPCGLWEVEVGFDSDVDPDDDEPPESKPPKVRWHGEVEEEILEEDAITGDPIQTEAEEPILITTPVVCPVLEIRRYELYPFDPDVILEYSHHTNSTTFWGAPAGTALMLPMDVDEEMIKPDSDSDPIKYAVVTYRIKFKIKPGVAEPWKARPLHHGSKYRTAAGLPPVVYRDRHGNPATINLTSGGLKLPNGSPPEHLSFNRFRKKDLNSLTLGPF